jgi:predicted double-glycine peptidase
MPDVKGNRQQDNASCGPAVVEAVLGYWLGKKKTPNQKALKTALETDGKTGTEPSDMQRVLKDYGLRADVRKGMTVDALRGVVDQGTTVILLIQAFAEDPDTNLDESWEEGHYIVARYVKKKRLSYYDPYPKGKTQKMKLKKLERRWRGIDEDGSKVTGLGIVVDKE